MDAAVQALQEPLESVGDALITPDQPLLFGAEQGPGGGVDPGATGPGEEPATRQRERPTACSSAWMRVAARVRRRESRARWRTSVACSLCSMGLQ